MEHKHPDAQTDQKKWITSDDDEIENANTVAAMAQHLTAHKKDGSVRLFNVVPIVARICS